MLVKESSILVEIRMANVKNEGIDRMDSKTPSFLENSGVEGDSFEDTR